MRFLQDGGPAGRDGNLRAHLVLKERLNNTRGLDAMLRWALIFLIISLIAALFGFTDIAAASAGIAKILFFIFVVVTVVFLVLGLAAGRAIR
jgi:uncharacterized membrane protein YtjA (UPF0391 family)